MFWFLYQRMENVYALEQVHLSQAVAQGVATAHSGKDAKVKSAFRKLLRRAFPEEYEQPKSLILPGDKDFE